MNVYMNGLLAAWGRWAVRGRDGGTGYPTCSPMFRDAPAGSYLGPGLPLGVGASSEECEITDQAVQRLADPADKELLRLAYQQREKTVDIARMIGCTRETVSRRLERVQARVKAHLEDIELGC